MRPELHGEPFNFGPQAMQNHTVLALVQRMAMHWKQVRWRDVSGLVVTGPYESGLLKLNCDKALHELHWHAVMGFEDTVEMTTEWYRAYYQETEQIATITCGNCFNAIVLDALIDLPKLLQVKPNNSICL